MTSGTGMMTENFVSIFLKKKKKVLLHFRSSYLTQLQRDDLVRKAKIYSNTAKNINNVMLL